MSVLIDVDLRNRVDPNVPTMAELGTLGWISPGMVVVLEFDQEHKPHAYKNENLREKSQYVCGWVEKIGHVWPPHLDTGAEIWIREGFGIGWNGERVEIGTRGDPSPLHIFWEKDIAAIYWSYTTTHGATNKAMWRNHDWPEPNRYPF